MMEKECNHYVKVCFKKAKLVYKRFYDIVFLEICKFFDFIPKRLAAKKQVLYGGRLKTSRRNGIQI